MSCQRNRKAQQRNRRYKEEPGGNSRTEKYNWNKKNSVDGLKKRMGEMEERISVLEDTTT